ncbi:MAG TPA: hypothetical protein VGD49_02755 [Longimicrobiales bacterium]
MSFVRILARVLTRPRLIMLLLTTGWRFRRRGWYRHPPFLPLPPANYMRWRMHTAYGDEQSLPTANELEAYLRWAARMSSAAQVMEFDDAGE